MTDSSRRPVDDSTDRVVTRRAALQLAGLFGLGAALSPVLVACAGATGPTSGSGAGSSGSAQPGGAASGTGGASGAASTLTLAFNRSLVSLDNKLNQFDAQVTVQRAVRQALTKIGPKLTPELVLAESFTATTPTEWTVKLRKDIHYSDNSPVTVEDVQTALEMYFKVTGGYVASQFPEQPTFTKVDDSTFTLTTKDPVVTLDSLMSNILISPAKANQPKELVTGIGSGPYKIKSADSGTGRYTLVANENYWGPDKAHLQQVQVEFLPEESARVIAIRKGEVDVIDTITPDSAKQLKSVDGVDVIETSGTRITQLFYNFWKTTGPLTDPKVREALSHAIDGKSLLSNLMSGLAEQCDGVVPATLAGYVKTGSYTYDPAKAKSMLAAAGASNLSIKFIWESGEFAGDAAVMEAIVEMLKDVGVTATLKEFQPGGDIGTWRRGEGGDWDVLANGYGNQTGLALTNLRGMYAGTAAKQKTHDTYQGYFQQDITDTLTQAGAESDRTKRLELLKKAQQDIWATWPCMWAFATKNLLAKRTRVKDLDLIAINSYDLASVTI